MKRTRDIHTVHPYPCKYPASAIEAFLTDVEDSILDPFCGSGTTLVQAAVLGWKNVIGFDSNPIASMISQFKLTSEDPAFFKIADDLLSEIRYGNVWSLYEPASFTFAGREHWFEAPVLTAIGRVVSFIGSQRQNEIATWLRVSLSRILNQVSRQDSETRYVAVDKNISELQALERFVGSCEVTLELLRSRPPLHTRKPIVKTINILDGLPLPDATIDRIVTSPPYANTMDYYLYHKQRMNVLGFDFKATQNHEIGSRHQYSSKKDSITRWESDYEFALREFARVLREGKYAFIIIGDSQIAGKKLDAAELTERLALALGFTVERIDSTPLAGRSRSFSHGFQRPNKFEHTIALRKLGKARLLQAQ